MIIGLPDELTAAELAAATVYRTHYEPREEPWMPEPASTAVLEHCDKNTGRDA